MRKKASAFKRFFAFLIDIIPIWLVMLVIYKETTGNSPFVADQWSSLTPGQMLVRDGWILIWIPYCILAELTPARGTFGKKVMGLQVLGAGGHRVSFGQALVRNLTKLVSAAPCWLGFIWAFFSKESNAWHDRIAKAGVYEKR